MNSRGDGKSVENLEPSAASPTERAFSILELVARTGTASIAEMISVLGIPRPTVSRIVASLEGYGYLRKTSGRGRYVIGPRLIGMAEDVLRATAGQAASEAVLLDLNRAIGETCSLGVMRGGEVVYLNSVASNAPLTLRFEAGQRAPLHCTSSGHLFLASMAKSQFDAYLGTGPWTAYTPRSITEPADLAARIQQVRETGYATNESTFVTGILGIAVPVTGQDGRLLASLTVSAPSARRTIPELERWLPRLRAAAERIGRAMREA